MIFYGVLVIFVNYAVLGQECYDDGNEFCIDQNDILSAELLPGSFLLMDQYYHENMSSVNNNNNNITSTDGSFVKAFDKMEYHRKRMNEYLCHGYMAEEIFKEFGSMQRVKRKNEVEPENSLPDILGEQNVTVHDKLLSDEGSTKYKDWLHRTTTLDDIYRHYVPQKSIMKKHEVYEDSEGGDIQEFEGELTGYTMPALSTGKMGRPGDQLVPASTGYGYPSYSAPGHHQGGAQHHPHPPVDYMPTIHEQHIYLSNEEDEDFHPHHHYHAPLEHAKSKSELTVRDFFEIALTALAFLAFGLFIIQLLMNITNPMTTMSTMVNTVPEIDQRFKRHAFDSQPLGYGSNEELNELAQRVLRSIEAVLVAQADSGNCLRRLLCEDNRFSRQTEGGRRIWIPVWSLGMSWVAGRMESRNRWSAMLESVKAAVLGLGRVDCESLYPDCQLWRERVKRRRRRRK